MYKKVSDLYSFKVNFLYIKHLITIIVYSEENMDSLKSKSRSKIILRYFSKLTWCDASYD